MSTEREWLEGLRYEDKFPERASLPEVVVAAFQAAGREAPGAERVNAIGYSAEESRIIDAEVKRRRVPDAWDRA